MWPNYLLLFNSVLGFLAQYHSTLARGAACSRVFKQSFVASASWTVLSHLQGSEVTVPPTTSSAVATYQHLAGADGGPQRKPWKGTSRKGVLSGKPLPSDSELVAELSDLAPQVFHETATNLIARLPPQHRRKTFGKGSGGSCLSRHRAQCAGGRLTCTLIRLRPR